MKCVGVLNCSLLIKVFAPFIFLTACFKKFDQPRNVDPSVSLISDTPDGVLYPLLRSFGLRVNSAKKELLFPPPVGARKNVVSTESTSVSLSADSTSVFEKLTPLFTMGVESRVEFSKLKSTTVELADLLSPSFQIAVDSEFRFQDSNVRIAPGAALLALISATHKEIEVPMLNMGDVASFLAHSSLFQSFGELLAASKSPYSNVKERNVGFAVGDFLVVREGSKLRHLALWLDHDLYFDAQSFGQSVLFRIATFEQLVQELSLRSDVDVRTLSFNAVRRIVPWTELAKSYRRHTGDALRIGYIRMAEDASGRSIPVNSEGLEVRRRRPE